jgi:UDP-N-acetylmuramoyl-tripeptide--D-alanyl-D-alanine ligase
MHDTKELYDIFEKCSGVCTDSRRVETGSMFFALHGASFDGNAFAADALSDGAAYAVVDSDEPIADHPEYADRMIRVADTLEALQSLAREHRRRLAIPVIGIVGSNGKTTTKELVSRVLAERFEVGATRGNLNNHIGVPLTLLSMTRDTEFGVVEMGASACGEIAALCGISEPNYGIITNIGRSHLEGFGGVEGIRRGKGELFDSLERNGGRAFVPQEDAVLVEMASERGDMAVEYYSRSIADGIESRLSGEYNRANIAAATAVGRYFDIDGERIREAIAGYEPDNNRSQAVATERNRLIVDCYNANPSSMQAATANLASQAGDDKILILGDMLELGQWSAEEHRKILENALRIDGARLLLIGSEFAKAAESLGATAAAKIISFATTEQAAEYLRTNPPSGATILIKGSHKWALERLVKLL